MKTANTSGTLALALLACVGSSGALAEDGTMGGGTYDRNTPPAGTYDRSTAPAGTTYSDSTYVDTRSRDKDNDNYDSGKWYVGVNGGQSMVDLDEGQIRAGLAAGGFATTSYDEDDTDSAFKLYGGYQFNRMFTVEIGAFDLGEFGYTATTTPAGTQGGELKVRGANLDVVGAMPFTERFSGFARIGAIYSKVEDASTATGAVVGGISSGDEKNAGFKGGIGLEFALTPMIALRLEGERYRVEDRAGSKSDIDMGSLGVVIHMGDFFNRSAARSNDGANEHVVAAPEAAMTVGPVALSAGPTATPEQCTPGQADDAGTDRCALDVSWHRAESAVTYLAGARGDSTAQWPAMGYGDTRYVSSQRFDHAGD